MSGFVFSLLNAPRFIFTFLKKMRIINIQRHIRTVLLKPYFRGLEIKEINKTPLNPLRHLPVGLNPFSSE